SRRPRRVSSGRGMMTHQAAAATMRMMILMTGRSSTSDHCTWIIPFLTPSQQIPARNGRDKEGGDSQDRQATTRCP
uniref:Uncharacterized protein n=1 Tax=Aegilops tauschii subsp. strangulata TaxID=200361 RepID=A0A453B4L1_AEGTS